MRRRFVKGLTLPEVAISALVIGGAVYAAGPHYKIAVQKSKAAALKTELTLIRKAIDQFHADTEGYPDKLEDLARETAPPIDWCRGGMMEWGTQVWNGPYIAFGEVGIGKIKNDPVSAKPYTIIRNEDGRVKVFSSAEGKDPSGTEFRDY
ncbi:MAG: hypothetical protein ACK53G_08145 [Armatimonadota bacterium]